MVRFRLAARGGPRSLRTEFRFVTGGMPATLAQARAAAGEHLLNGIDLRALGYECAMHVAGEHAAHVLLRKRP